MEDGISSLETGINKPEGLITRIGGRLAAQLEKSSQYWQGYADTIRESGAREIEESASKVHNLTTPDLLIIPDLGRTIGHKAVSSFVRLETGAFAGALELSAKFSALLRDVLQPKP